MEKIAIIGVGNIGEALLQGLIASKVEPHHIIATCRSEERVAALAERYAIQATTDNVEAAADADVVFLCVKPNQIIDVIGEIAETVASNSVPTVLVSMAAGVDIADMEEAISSAGTPIMRVMPNTPMLVGKGVLAVSAGRYVEDEQREAVEKLLTSAGRVVAVPEKAMHAVTALSGSGPAYYFLLTEALIDAGVALGLPRDLATELATQTCAGAGALLDQHPDPVGLRAAVSSPGGTTVAAIRELEESGLRAAIYRATDACATRSEEY
ncbi:pyrroline-5-carboxylate reductase [uncultured Corynebacterium sp.]|uniref:pyrroline-5-carboxylate reductase n=1 Tax=uncultured Corynebacterium sp. TaxID=159447 RepID=UPI0028893F77|nr:pyrroline-5-carboxylate reductase [uncultured Corynebacterium sp.]